MVQIYEFARKFNSGKLYIVTLTTLIFIIYLLFNTVAKNTVVKNNIDSNHTKLSFVYENTGLSVYGRWMDGFKHERRNVTEDSMLKCLRSARERRLHFVFRGRQAERGEPSGQTQVLAEQDSDTSDWGFYHEGVRAWNVCSVGSSGLECVLCWILKVSTNISVHIHTLWRIQNFPDGSTNSQSGCAKRLFCTFFPKNAWKWKNSDPKGARPWCPPGIRQCYHSSGGSLIPPRGGESQLQSLFIMADQRPGAPGTNTPSQSIFILFSCSFYPKSCQIIGFRQLLRGWRPGLGNPGSATDLSLFDTRFLVYKEQKKAQNK